MSETDEKELAARELFAQATAMFKAKRWPEAESLFGQSATLFPTSLAWLGTAIACWEQQNFARAAICAEWCLHAIPIRETAESQAGLARFEANDWRGVEEWFRKLVNTPPVDTPTYLFLCIALVNLGRINEAGEQLQSAWKQEWADSEPR
jgi:tetratricopeptide (TPR) repeat protein